jgi:hypothetical protein
MGSDQNEQAESVEQFQQQAREMLRAQQEAFLEAVKAWRKAMSGGEEVPTWPRPRSLDMAPTPNEAAEASYAFAAKLLADQSRFMEELSSAMSDTEKRR